MIIGKLNQNFVVVSVVQAFGKNLVLPEDCIDLTDRTDGPWMGKIYHPDTDTFTSPPITKNDLKDVAEGKYENWWRIKQTRIEVEARTPNAPQLPALRNLETNLYQDYIQAFLAYMAA